MQLKIHNSLSRAVYDYAHIGNARPIIVFDVLFRLLRHLFGPEHVKYVRNLTDVDDKINARAAEEGVPISEVTARTIRQFHEDIGRLNVLPPSVEPRATEHIAEMQEIISRLIDAGCAYVAEGHVLYDVSAKPDYGILSKRTLDEMMAGARVEVAPYKRNPMDFVLWKPSKEGEPAWESPWGAGRPGWHIECSAMSWKHLGETFDIHGGGIDLQFPHDLLEEWPGEVLRLNMLRTHYRAPIDWTRKGLEESRRVLDKWYRVIGDAAPAEMPDPAVVEALCDDLHTPKAIAELHRLASDGRAAELKASAALLGLLPLTAEEWEAATAPEVDVDEAEIERLIAERNAARAAKNWGEADRIRDALAARGIILKDGPQGTTWEVKR